MLFARWLLLLALVSCYSCCCEGKLWKGSARLSPKKPWVALTSFAFDLGAGEVRATKRTGEKERGGEREETLDRCCSLLGSTTYATTSAHCNGLCPRTADLGWPTSTILHRRPCQGGLRQHQLFAHCSSSSSIASWQGSQRTPTTGMRACTAESLNGSFRHREGARHISS